ncbi:MAG: PHP domain-containing protein [Clostridia bacterium]|nr:PHP domain-containing protein [Clostridia bacterium]
MKEYLLELHYHTAEVSPCGRVPAREGIRLYKDMGYDAVCITDHFYQGFFDKFIHCTWFEKIDAYLDGYRKAKHEGEKIGLKVLLGMEYCFPGTTDDILVYGIDESFLCQHEDLHLKNEAEFKEIAQKNDLLLIQAHPFRKKISKVYDDLVEGYEVFNGNPRHDSQNERVEAFAQESGKIMVSGSDFHQLPDAGTGGLYLPECPQSSKELAALLKKIRTPRLIRGDRA